MKSLKIVLLISLILGLTYCNQGDTDGGIADAFPGSPLVAGAINSGATLSIIADTNVPLGGSIEYLVEARDANGAPLPFIPITCDTEQGLALLEPTVNPPTSTTAGIASTSSGGVMSGVLGLSLIHI